MKKQLCLLLALLLLTVSVQAADFTDTKDHWAQEEIKIWSDLNVVQGDNGTFRPEDNVTRGELAVILDRIKHYEAASENTFTDLEPSAFYTQALLKANQAGVIQGGDGAIRPKDPVTRQECAVILGRAFEVLEVAEASVSFGDFDQAAEWARGYLSAFIEKGWMQGADGLLMPQAPVTRAQLVKLLDNMGQELVFDTKPSGEPSAAPVVSSSPLPSPSPSASPAPSPSASPAPTEEPEVTDVPSFLPPEETTAPEPTEQPQRQNTVSVTLNAGVIGMERLAEPAELEIQEGETAAQVIVRFLEQAGLEYENTGTIEEGMYLTRVKSGTTQLQIQPVISPEADAQLKAEMSYYDPSDFKSDSLGQMDISSGAGWMYQVNGVFLKTGLSAAVLKPGDKIEILFTLNFGKDIGDTYLEE